MPESQVSQEVQDNYFNGLFKGFGDQISAEDFYFLTTVKQTVNVYDQKGWENYKNNLDEDNRNGMAYTSSCEHVMNFQESMLDGSKFPYGRYYRGYDPYFYDRSSVIMHELGHSFGMWKSEMEGSNYPVWDNA